MPADHRLSPSDIERARSIAAAAADHDQRGWAGVAERIRAAGFTLISRTSLYGFAVGKYKADPTHIAIKVLSALDGWTCPYTQEHITPQDCRTIALAPAPTHNPARMTHWRACLHCPGRPEPLKED